MIANGTADATHSPVADLYGDPAFPDPGSGPGQVLEQATRGERAAYLEAARPEPCPEAAFSLTLKGTIGGHEAMLTIRAQSATTFAANVAAVRGMLDAASPTPHAPLQQTYGAREAAKALGPVPPAEGWCAIHQVQMPLQTNARGQWRSHKTAEGSWCKGR